MRCTPCIEEQRYGLLRTSASAGVVSICYSFFLLARFSTGKGHKGGRAGEFWPFSFFVVKVTTGSWSNFG